MMGLAVLHKSGLKVQLFLTFAVILFLAMGLVCVVVLTIQQHTGIQAEIHRSETFLAAISQEIVRSNGLPDMSRDLRHLGNEKKENYEKDICISWTYADTTRQIPDHCESLINPEQFLSGVATARYSTVSFTGSVWAVFTYASKTLIVTAPLKIGDKTVGSVAIAKSLVPLYETIRKEGGIVIVYLLVNAIIFATIGLFRLIHLVVRPIEKLVGLAEKYRHTEGTNFLIGQSSGEFGKLTTSLNEMLHRIEADNQKLRETVASLENANKELERNRQGMVQTEKLAAVGRLSAGLAHEIGNPLGIVQGYVDMLGKVELTEEEKEQFAKRAGQELQRINSLIRQLLDYARPAHENLANVSVHELIRDVLELLPARKKSTTVSFSTSLDAVFDTVFAGRDRLRQVFLNCLLNAVDAIESSEVGQGEINISTRNTKDEKGSTFLEVFFSDNGIGISPEHLEIVFDPFFTTKDPGKGTGLGLSVSYAIIENFGGKISVARKAVGGAEVLVSLPVAGNCS